MVRVEGIAFRKLYLFVMVGMAALLYVRWLATHAVPGGSGNSPVLPVLLAWSPTILKGFAVNLGISVLAITLTTFLGAFAGIAAHSRFALVRGAAAGFTHLFQNTPWLVILFYCMLLMPFSIQVGTLSVPLPDWLKAVFGITLGAAANMAEIVRGAMGSVPTGQWESSAALGFSRAQTLRLVILPQSVRRMLPPWMNLYALVVISTPLCSIVGVHEGMSAVSDMLAAHDSPDLLLPAYLYLLVIFFALSYPVSRGAQWLERALYSGDGIADR